MKVAAPVLEVNGELFINPHFGRAKLIGIADLETGEIKTADNPALGLERGKGVRMAGFLLEEGVRVLLVKDIGVGAFEKIKSAGIEIYLVPKGIKEFQKALDLFKKGELQVLKEPLSESGNA